MSTIPDVNAMMVVLAVFAILMAYLFQRVVTAEKKLAEKKLAEKKLAEKKLADKKLADNLAVEKAARKAAEQRAKTLADNLAVENAARKAAEQRAKTLADDLAIEKVARKAAVDKAVKTPSETAAQHERLCSVCVPQDFKTLNEAVAEVEKEDHLTTIIVGKGDYWGDAPRYLKISSAMNLVGAPGVPKEEIVINDSIAIQKNIQGNVHVQHLKVRGGDGYGVCGWSSFTMDDVLVDDCTTGVAAVGTAVVGRCTNVEVQRCSRSGVYAEDGGCITLIGPKTTVHNNCRLEERGDGRPGKRGYHGLALRGASSSIQLVAPLTKETVSINNRISNWGVNGDANVNQIKTI